MPMLALLPPRVRTEPSTSGWLVAEKFDPKADTNRLSLENVSLLANSWGYEQRTHRAQFGSKVVQQRTKAFDHDLFARDAIDFAHIEQQRRATRDAIIGPHRVQYRSALLGGGGARRAEDEYRTIDLVRQQRPAPAAR